MPLAWSIVLMVVGGLLAFWLVVWAIPKYLTGKGGIGNLGNRNPIWRRDKGSAGREAP